MYGLFTIFSIILLPFTILLLAVGCGKKNKSPSQETGMPGSTKPPESPTPTGTAAANTPISAKQAEASKQMSEGALNWSALKLPSKEDCEKTNLDECDEDKVFLGKVAKLSKSNKKLPLASLQAVSAEHPTPLEGKQTNEKGEVTQGTVMRTVDPAGQTQCTVAMPTVAAPVQARKKGSCLKTVDQTLDATVLKETPRSPAPGPLRSRQSLMKEINVELSPNHKDKNEKGTQYDQVLPSCIQPTQLLPSTTPGAVPTKAKETKETNSAKKAPGVPAVKKGVKSKKSIQKTSKRKVDRSKSKKKTEEAATQIEQDEHESLDSATQSDTHIIAADSCLHHPQQIPLASLNLPPAPSAKGNDAGNVAAVPKKDRKTKENAGKSVQLGAVSLYMKA